MFEFCTMKHLYALLSGLLFGLGLILAGMAEPQKVKAFLDLAGAWNPSLALVMGGAIAVASLAFARAKHLRRAWSGEPIDLPQSRVIDARLLGGGLLFGIGWGIAGLCPGPAIVALGSGLPEAALFVGTMLLGMAMHGLVFKPEAAATQSG
jgi:uncharacterized protein